VGEAPLAEVSVKLKDNKKNQKKLNFPAILLGRAEPREHQCVITHVHTTLGKTLGRANDVARARASPAAMDTRAMCVQSWETGRSPITELDLIFECVCARARGCVVYVY